MQGIIVGDNYYDSPRTSIARTNGAHRIAGLLRNKGYNVEVLDFFNSWTIEELETILESYPVDFIGLSFGLGRLEDDKVNKFIALTKSMYPKVTVIAGGNQILINKIEGIDLYFRGFADGAIDDISTYLETGAYPNESYTIDIQSDNRKIVDCNKHYSKFDLTNLRTIYTDNDFLTPTENYTLEVGRGCIFKCKFCNFPLIGKKENDYIRTKEDLKNEIVENYNKWGIKQYNITDDTFNDNELKIDILYEISQEIDFELSFMCYARVDLLKAKPNTLEKMIAFGVKGMHFGIESFTPAASKTIGKGFSGEPLKQYLKEIRQKHPSLHLLGTFIIGLPEETIEQFEENIHYAVDEKLLDTVIAYPLVIPRDTGGSDTSTFTREWRSYGYEEIDRTEFDQLVLNPKYEMFRGMDFDFMQKHCIPWKSKYLNFLDAEIAGARIRNDVDHKTCMGGWTCFTTTYTGIPLDTLLQLKRRYWDWDLIKTKANEFVNEYKTKKLASVTKIIKGETPPL